MIGILNAYHFDPDADYQKEYSELFLNFVKETFPEKAHEVVEFKVGQGKFPASVEDCDIWFITGSPKSVYDDIPWVHQLCSFTQELHRKKKKTIGICFGHQMVAHALGGEVIKSPKGWGVGIRSYQILKSEKWMNAPLQKVSLLFSHQDQVIRTPPDAMVLASDDFCEYQMTQIGDHILTMQGHPEFTVNFARERLLSRKTLVPNTTFDQAISSYGKSEDSQVLKQWIAEFAKL